MVNIGLFSYLFAAVAFSVLTILLIFSWRGWQLGASVTLASALSAVWAVISAISALYPAIPLELMQAAELARLASWCFFLLKIIELKQDEESPSSGKTIYTSLFFLIQLRR